MLEKEIQNLQATAKWAETYIDEFRANDEFDPFDIIMDRESYRQQLYRECVNFLCDIEETIVEKCKEHKMRKDAIICGQGIREDKCSS